MAKKTNKKTRNKKTGNQDPDVAAIKALDKAWSKAAHAKDLVSVMKFYARDARVAWTDQPPAKGRKGILGVWKAVFDGTPDLWVEFKPTRIDISKSRDMAVDFGVVHFAPHTKANDTENTAKYLMVWKRENGAWKVLYDSWNWNGAHRALNAPA
jgi:uncharacterized protein (TIGR02246 family)